MKQDRFLVGILVGIALLVVVALVVFFTRADPQTYGPEDTPDGVVHNYVVAIFQRDYQKAYSYLATGEGSPTYERFRENFLLNQQYSSQAGIEVGSVEYTKDGAAIVSLNVVYNNGDPFSDGYRSPETALLVQEGSSWKIRQMPYSFWNYEWFQVTPVPVKAP